MPPRNDSAYFSSWTQAHFAAAATLITPELQATHNLEFPLNTPPPLPPPRQPDSQTASQSVRLSGCLAGLAVCLRDGSFGKTAARCEVIHLDSGEVLRSHTSDKNTHRQQTNTDISVRACMHTNLDAKKRLARSHTHSRDSLLTCTCLVDESSQISLTDRYRVAYPCV